ncbi:pdz/dhr/glgf [Metarhizium album ARSEF 1941]|uniref:Probable 26S proteasome regulatory subunit p27 n=1 Tax=Metarhizium album (strain ARSEF 1941) TaxID=1081103 RepID=A0A0B2WNV5_METAS|nr:pdz/dhr/glgf [Metarhizium album ARSEF 1941]KHN95319.1 pdz/dhr/glgf [Metarhizium album ARSEF 1941]
MDSMHAPTVPSGPTSNSRVNGNVGHLSFGELQRKKEDLEEELKALGGVLDSHGVNMESPLVTRDGYPRSDIDVAQIRTTRARIVRLRNDYKDLMKNIEKYLHQHFASLDEGDENVTPASSTVVPPVLPDSQADTLDEAFAKVNTVTIGGPADRAGLKEGDEIRNLGYVNRSNHDNLRKVAECVQGNEGRSIFIRVSRASGAAKRQELRLTLTPTRNWGGRGLLGCHILPL